MLEEGKLGPTQQRGLLDGGTHPKTQGKNEKVVVYVWGASPQGHAVGVRDEEKEKRLQHTRSTWKRTNNSARPTVGPSKLTRILEAKGKKGGKVAVWVSKGETPKQPNGWSKIFALNNTTGKIERTNTAREKKPCELNSRRASEE